MKENKINDLAYKLPPKYPLTGAVAAYINIEVDSSQLIAKDMYERRICRN